MDLGTRLYTWRTHLKLTLQEVAKRTGQLITQPTLTKLECGSETVRWFVLESVITKGLRLPLHRFFGRVPKIHIPAPTGRPRTVSRPIIQRQA